MRIAKFSVAIVLAMIGCHTPGAPGLGEESAPPAALAITHVAVADGTDAPLQRDMTVLIRGTRITAVGPSATTAVPADARIIDGSLRYVIPGLWDMHVHLTSAGRLSVPLFSVNGVTGVRDMGGDLDTLDGFRADIARGTLLGPRVYRAGPFLDGPKQNALYRVTLRSADDARHAVDSLKRLGVDYLKIHNRVPREAYFALLAEARAVGLRVGGHIPRGISPVEAALAGQASFEHTENLLEATHFADSASQRHTPREDFALLSGAAADSFFAVLRRNGTSMDPTLIEYYIFAHEGDTSVTNDARLKYVVPELRAYWNRYFPTDTLATIASTAGRREYLRRFMGLIYGMHDAGVPILTGTDVGAPYIYPGFSLHDELALLVEAGIPPAKVLKAATSGAAGYLGVSDSVGTVQAGKLADLVIIDGNPLTDIRSTRLIHAVILNGRVIDAAARRRILESTARAAAAGRTEREKFDGRRRRATAAADPFAVIAEFDRLAARDLWPGFDAARTPLALFDGERTLLFRHPSPPADFSAVPGRSGAFQVAGRFEAVTSNSSAMIGGVATATLMPPAPGSTDRSRAGTAIHEAFHVFQRAHHPGWSANEADLFTYPMHDPAQLAGRRREYALLRRALEQPDSASAACDAFVAVIERGTRLETLGATGAAYERKNELNEGLASYVQARATSASLADVAPDSAMSADAIRWYAYVSGPVLGRLLDRFAPRWRDSLEANDKQSLDELLGAAVARTNTERPMCGLTPAERARIDSGAARDAAALGQRLADERTRFLARTGWRIEIDASRQLLFPQGFDPLNVRRVTAGEVLHTRFVKLGGSTGSVEVLGRGALSEGAGAHPLFNGVRLVTITGLDQEPVVREENGEVSVSAPGVTVRFRGATVAREGRLIRVTLRD